MADFGILRWMKNVQILIEVKAAHFVRLNVLFKTAVNAKTRIVNVSSKSDVKLFKLKEMINYNYIRRGEYLYV